MEDEMFLSFLEKIGMVPPANEQVICYTAIKNHFCPFLHLFIHNDHSPYNALHFQSIWSSCFQVIQKKSLLILIKRTSCPVFTKHFLSQLCWRMKFDFLIHLNYLKIADVRVSRGILTIFCYVVEL